MRFVVTAGPTREPLDPVRYLSNRSSGKMGYAIAGAALAQRHEVVLISGPVAIAPPQGAELVQADTADQMFDAVHAAVRRCQVLVMCAAVADYKPAHVALQKIKKQRAPFGLELVPTRDILRSLPRPRSFFLVGFAAETHEVESSARAKLAEKDCDMLVANNVGDPAIGMESDENAVTIFLPNGEMERLTRAPKKKIARVLVKIISRERQKSFDIKNVRMNDSV